MSIKSDLSIAVVILSSIVIAMLFYVVKKTRYNSVKGYAKRTWPFISLCLALYLLANSIIISVGQCDVQHNKNASYAGIVVGLLFCGTSMKSMFDDHWVTVMMSSFQN